MARPVRYQLSFRTDLAYQVRWLRPHRAPEEQARLRRALARFRTVIGQNPSIGEQIGDAAGPVWLAMLMHEHQDRERFSADLFD